MGVWTYFASTTQTTVSKPNDDGGVVETVVSTESVSKQVSQLEDGIAVLEIDSKVSTSSTTIPGDESLVKPHTPNRKRVSFHQALSFAGRNPTRPKEHCTPSTNSRPAGDVAPNAKHHFPPRVSRSERRAKKSALRLQALITGEITGTTSAPAVTPVVARARLEKIKSQLSQPKSANKVISELRRLPVQVGDGLEPTLIEDAPPIHAVCLGHVDAEEDKLHFKQLQDGKENPLQSVSMAALPAAPAGKLADVLKDIQLVDLLRAPDLGLGQPGDGNGLLAGAVPTAETVLNGVKMITPQLLTLGYATGRMIAPDHRGIHPPTDRMSVLTYWWGLEIAMPPPTLEYLASAQSVSSSIVNFLSAMALVNNGVREILPLIRYIAQYIDMEYRSVKAQDQGQGVVCAATWIMPAALVPRPWDFPEAPSQEEGSAGVQQSESKDDTTKHDSAAITKPRPISSMLDIVTPPPSMPS